MSTRWLTEAQLDLLHDASLEIMAGTGMRFFSAEAIELFRRAGAGISDGNLVRVPASLVERALRSAPRTITIHDRDGGPAMRLGEGPCYFGTGSDCSFIYDPRTGERRKAVLADVVDAVRLVDALPDIDFLMSMFLPSDVPASRYERCQMKVMLEESTKPIVFCGIRADSTRDAVAMAAEVAGGLETLQGHPFVLNYINTTSALRHNEESVARLLFAARRNLPTIYAPANCRGTTAPMSVAGMMALGNAGQLAGLVLSQLATGRLALHPEPPQRRGNGHAVDEGPVRVAGQGTCRLRAGPPLRAAGLRLGGQQRCEDARRTGRRRRRAEPVRSGGGRGGNGPECRLPGLGHDGVPRAHGAVERDHRLAETLPARHRGERGDPLPWG